MCLKKARQSKETDAKEPSRLKRILRFAVLFVVIALALSGGWHWHMRLAAEREGRRIAQDEEYGAAWETVDYVGEGDLGVLFFHNLHGTPQDFRLVYDELEERRIHYYTPMLGAERPSPAIQNGFTSATFAGHAERAYAHLSQRCKRVIVVGASAGGVQAADIASRFPVERGADCARVRYCPEVVSQALDGVLDAPPGARHAAGAQAQEGEHRRRRSARRL